MAFSTDDTLLREFLQSWPLERLRTMTLTQYTTAGDKDCFIRWLESDASTKGRPEAANRTMPV